MRSHSPRGHLVLLTVVLALLAVPPARADEMSAEQRKAVQKGLEYLAKNQHKDGHWEALGGQYPVTMTGISGMALLMEGSTIREGKYKDNIRRAADWLMAHSMPNGMIGNPNIPGEAGRYMYGHGFGMLFLSCVVGEEEEGDRRRRLVDILERACKFSHAAQTNRGGWGYVSAHEGSNFDEGSVTITQVQALRAARNAGIIVPQEAIKMAQKYLQRFDQRPGRRGVQPRRRRRRRRPARSDRGGHRLRLQLRRLQLAAGQEVVQVLPAEPGRTRRRHASATTSTPITTTPRPFTSSARTATAKLFPESQGERTPDLERLQEGQLRRHHSHRNPATAAGPAAMSDPSSSPPCT